MKKIDVVIPVYNAEKSLQGSVLVLLDYLNAVKDYSWNIVIADNASTDRTSEIAGGLSLKYRSVKYRYIPRKGRGYALKMQFLHSSADIVCYMDVDLSTNLRYLRMLIEGISSGYDAAVGSRLMRGSRVKRSIGREIISRGYNLLVKLLFFNKFSDAQCGFKVFKTEVIKQLIPLVKNDNWFFDTEILLLLEHNKFRTLEVPVEWTHDLHSTVNIPATILEDLCGLLRLRFTIHKKEITNT
jgi:glycosyltransferase involved in cell wall biosynthesis